MDTLRTAVWMGRNQKHPHRLMFHRECRKIHNLLLNGEKDNPLLKTKDSDTDIPYGFLNMDYNGTGCEHITTQELRAFRHKIIEGGDPFQERSVLLPWKQLRQQIDRMIERILLRAREEKDAAGGYREEQPKWQDRKANDKLICTPVSNSTTLREETQEDAAAPCHQLAFPERTLVEVGSISEDRPAYSIQPVTERGPFLCEKRPQEAACPPQDRDRAKPSHPASLYTFDSGESPSSVLSVYGTPLSTPSIAQWRARGFLSTPDLSSVAGVQECVANNAYATPSSSNRTSGASSPAKGQSRPTGRGISKQFRQPRDDGQGDPGSRDSSPDGSRAQARESEGRLWPCPFFKYNPVLYSKCGAAKLKSISEVREHLGSTRHYRGKAQCIHCLGIFDSQSDMYEHIRKRTCPERFPEPNTVTVLHLAKFDEAKKEKNAETRWRKYYEILFPTEPVPAPCLEPVLDTMVHKLQIAHTTIRGIIERDAIHQGHLPEGDRSFSHIRISAFPDGSDQTTRAPIPSGVLDSLRAQNIAIIEALADLRHVPTIKLQERIASLRYINIQVILPATNRRDSGLEAPVGLGFAPAARSSGAASLSANPRPTPPSTHQATDDRGGSSSSDAVNIETALPTQPIPSAPLSSRMHTLPALDTTSAEVEAVSASPLSQVPSSQLSIPLTRGDSNTSSTSSPRSATNNNIWSSGGQSTPSSQTDSPWMGYDPSQMDRQSISAVRRYDCGPDSFYRNFHGQLMPLAAVSTPDLFGDLGLLNDRMEES